MATFFHKFYYCYWLAITPIFTRQNIWLSTDNKIMYRKYAKQAIRQKFPTHPIFHHPAWLEWHETMERNFRRECERADARGVVRIMGFVGMRVPTTLTIRRQTLIGLFLSNLRGDMEGIDSSSKKKTKSASSACSIG